MGVQETINSTPAPLAKLIQCQLVTTAGDERVNLLLNVLILFSLPPLGAFVIYFVLSTLLIWCAALFTQCKWESLLIELKEPNEEGLSHFTNRRLRLPCSGA